MVCKMLANIFKNYSCSNSIKIGVGLSQRLQYFSVQPTTDGEKQIFNALKLKLPKAESIAVEDISGGCGSMYQIKVVSNDFRGKSMVEQHRLVSEILKEQVKSMHGIRIFTQTPKN